VPGIVRSMPTRALPRENVLDSNRRYASVLLVLFVFVFVGLGWAPSYRADWLLENVLVFLILPCLVVSHSRLPLSKISYTMIFLFLCLHEIGAHYTYAEVPYDAWWHSLTGQEIGATLGWERNHFDRLVHFLYGLLVVYPVREVFLRVSNVSGFWGYLFPLLVVMSSSLTFELFEWVAALLFGGDLGMAYLGTQGDEWDSHKDSALATLGALLATAVVMLIHRSLDRDFTREWIESLEVKHPEPLGEVAIERLREARDAEAED
jgi:putative membrane protein